MCSWCHCHLLSPTARCCVCFCTEAAGQGTPHLPLHSQVTLSNHSSDQRGKTRAYRHLVNTRATFTHERQSCGRQPGDTRGGGFSATGPGAKWFVVGITGAPTLLQKPQHRCHGCSRNCCGKSTGERGGLQLQRPLRFTRMDLQDWTSVREGWNGEWKAQQSLTYFNSIAGEKTHLAFLNNLLHNVMICD